ncbi:hypothetical protein F383_29359 [Gossypium arboreum]|uniref:Uncharacterized protein n=1 Tax=Gossypium arboreum TaxID=29729 RepID=A0A0B0MF37_GOSAR|nr:hypothetical protein F383_38119 [Gossypium arboreum]KHG04574.1 hypothetical protein F383_29359 [Gossypium arboreum]
MSGTCISHIMRASVRPFLGHGIGKMCQCKTMSGTWHRHEYRELV